MKPTIKETVVGQIEKTELLYIVEDALLGVKPDGHDWDSYDWEHAYKKTYWKEGEHIPVEMLQEVLDELKEKGANHVQIYSHSDHNGYYFTGVKLELMDEKELKNRKKKKLEDTLRSNEKSLQRDEGNVERVKKLVEEQRKELEGLNED